VSRKLSIEPALLDMKQSFDKKFLPKITLKSLHKDWSGYSRLLREAGFFVFGAASKLRWETCWLFFNYELKLVTRNDVF
jgi:hypothetical protein